MIDFVACWRATDAGAVSRSLRMTVVRYRSKRVHGHRDSAAHCLSYTLASLRDHGCVELVALSKNNNIVRVAALEVVGVCRFGGLRRNTEVPKAVRRRSFGKSAESGSKGLILEASWPCEPNC